MISVAQIATTSWVCDPRFVSYASEQAERLISHARANKVVHNFAWTPLHCTTDIASVVTIRTLKLSNLNYAS